MRCSTFVQSRKSCLYVKIHFPSWTLKSPPRGIIRAYNFAGHGWEDSITSSREVGGSRRHDAFQFVVHFYQTGSNQVAGHGWEDIV